MIHALSTTHSTTNPGAGFSEQSFRQSLGNFPTGVTIITAKALDGSLLGLTVSSFNSVSLNPPLILWSLALKSKSLEALRNATYYAINVLSDQQLELAQRFASTQKNRFAGLDVDEGLGGAALIRGSVAQFECFNRSRYEEGDHLIFVGEVKRCRAFAGNPLIYVQGGFPNAIEDPAIKGATADAGAPAVIKPAA